MARGKVNRRGQIPSAARRAHPVRRSAVAREARVVARLIKLPPELFCEIAGYLKPNDLLTVARTCKALRQRVMSRYSAIIWRRARRNVRGLPEPPSYLSEPAYAFFIFERRCYECYRSLTTQSIDKTFWRLAKRYCSGCRKDMIVPHDWTACRIIDRVRDEFPEFLGKQFLTTEEGPWSWSGSGITTKHLYHMPEVRAFTSTWKSFRSDQVAKRKLVQEQVAIVQERMESAERLKAFVQSRTTNRQPGKPRRRHRRVRG